MNQAQWDAHERTYCERCEHNRKGMNACPVKAMLHNKPNDQQALKVTRRLGFCSQFSPKHEPEPKTAKKQPRKRK